MVKRVRRRAKSKTKLRKRRLSVPHNRTNDRVFLLAAIFLAIVSIIILFNPAATTFVTLDNSLTKTSYEVDEILEGEILFGLQPTDLLPPETVIDMAILSKAEIPECKNKVCPDLYLCPNGDTVPWMFCNKSKSPHRCKNVTYANVPPEIYEGHPDKYCCFLNVENCIGDVSIEGPSNIILDVAKIEGTYGFTAGRLNKAIRFDDGYVDLGENARLSGTTDFTVEAWIKTTGGGGIQGSAIGSQPSEPPQMIIAQRNGGYNGEYWVRITGDGKINFAIYNEGYQFNFNSADHNSLKDGNWHHIAAVRKGTYGYIYIDTVKKGEVNGVGKKLLNDNLKVAVGKDLREGDPFHGIIDEVRIWKVARTQPQIVANYNKEIDAVIETRLQSYWKFNEVENSYTPENMPVKTTYTATMIVDDVDVSNEADFTWSNSNSFVSKLIPDGKTAFLYGLTKGATILSVLGEYGENKGNAAKTVYLAWTITAEEPVMLKGLGGITGFVISTSTECTEREKSCCIEGRGTGNYYGEQLECSVGECWDDCTESRTYALSDFITDDVNWSSGYYYASGKGFIGGTGSGFAYCYEPTECLNKFTITLEDLEYYVPDYNEEYIFSVNMTYQGTKLDSATENFIVGGGAVGPNCPDNDYLFVTGNWSNWSDCINGTMTRTRTLHGTYIGSDSNCPSTKDKTDTDYDSCGCTPNWNCEWQFCTMGEQQEKLCQDLNYCEADYVDGTRICCIENWECSSWSSCEYGEQTRSCYDNNGCGTELNEPELTRICEKPFFVALWWLWVLIALIVVIVVLFAAKIIPLPSGKRKRRIGGVIKAKTKTPAGEYSELTNYINQALGYGATRQEIRTKLHDAGWPSDAIEKAFRAAKK